MPFILEVTPCKEKKKGKKRKKRQVYLLMKIFKKNLVFLSLLKSFPLLYILALFSIE